MKDSLRLTAMQMAGGVSKQPPHLRLPGQLEDAQNLNLSVVDGINKRSGSVLERVVTGLDAGGNYRTFTLNRAEDEEYNVIFGVIGSAMSIKAFRIGGSAATVTISTAAQKYLNLNGATADQIRARIVEDTVFWINTTVMVGTLPGATYSLAATWPNYDQMVAQTPADDTFHRTTNDSGENLAGYYKYDVDGVTFSTRRFPTVSGRELASAFGQWDDTADQPFAFRIGFQRRALAVSGAAWDGTNTITKTGAFTEVRDGEFVFVNSGTGFTGVELTWYQVMSHTDDAIVIGSGINITTGDVDVVATAAATADIALTGLGGYFEVSINAITTPEDMHSVAAEIQLAFKDVGAEDALVAWVDDGYQIGHFVITSPYRGSGATFFGPYAPSAGGTDLQALGQPFNGTGHSPVVGTGTLDANHLDTLDVDDRWTETVESGQADAQIDPATMPVRMTRTQVGSTSVFEVVAPTFEARATGTPTSNPSPSLWKKVASQGTLTYTAAATAVCTSVAHGLTTGDTVSITGSSGTASIDGNRVVTVTTADAFTVPVNTTAGGGSARWRKGGVTISDVAEKDARLAYIGGNKVVYSQVNDDNDFYIADAANIIDSDPVDAPIKKATNIDFYVPFRKTAVAFTREGKQFELNTPEAFTQSTAGWTDSTGHQTRSVQPKVMGSRLYFVGQAENYSVLYEYIYNDLTVSSTAFEVTTHVIDYLPADIRTIEADTNNGMVLVLPDDDGLTARMFVYKAFWNGDQKQQSAWGRWNFNNGHRICDIAILQDRLWMLIEICGNFSSAAGSPNTTITSAGHGLSNGATIVIPAGASPAALVGSHTIANVTTDTFTIPVVTTATGYGKWSLNQYTLETIILSRQTTETGWTYPVHLDRQMRLTGIHSAGTTTFTLPIAARGSTVNKIVLGPAFGASVGTEVDITGYSGGNDITVTGNYAAGEVIVGGFMNVSAQLTRPFLRDGRGDVDFYGSIITTDLMVCHYRSGPYSVLANYSDTQEDVTTSFTPASVLSAAADSILKAHAMGNVELFSATISSTSAKPFTISAIQWVGKPADILR